MATVLEQGNISIHTESIFPIIKKWLYSDHEIFLRELVSNAVDAMKKLMRFGLNARIDGDGFVTGQDPQPGTPAGEGTVCRLTLARVTARQAPSARTQ